MMVALISGKEKDVFLTSTQWALLPVVYICGVLVTRLSHTFLVFPTEDITFCLVLKVTFYFWNNQLFEEQLTF